MAVQLSDAMVKFFDEKNFAHIATVMPDGSPQVTPVWVDYDGEHILVNVADGRTKVENMRRDPRVAVEVMDHANPYAHFTVRGRVVGETGGDVAENHIDSMAKKYLGQDKYPFRQPGEVRILFKIEPEHVAGMGV